MTERIPPRAQGCMGATGRGALAVLWIVWFVAIVAEAQSIDFTVKPAGFSSDASPKFAFVVVAGANGANPCAPSQCAFQCKLDQAVALDCSGRTFTASDLADGSHMLTVSGSASNGTLLAPSLYSWIVDTVPPTASVVTSPLYTSAINITVNVTFSEDCPTFECSSASSCDLVVRGPAWVLPSTLVTLSPGRAYSLQVSLSTQVLTGSVTLTTARFICRDAAGNRYQRSSNSTTVVRFSRTQPTLNLWTSLPNWQVETGALFWTAQATNAPDSVPIFLDFSEPVLGTAEDVQGFLNVSHGVLLPRERKSRGNRRFAFSLLLNSTGTAAVTVVLPGNTTASRYGVPLAETATVSFLHDVDYPEVLLSTNSRAHTRDRLLPVLVQFTKPVFSFNNSGVTVAGGVLRSFREISKTTYAIVVFASGDSSRVSVSVAQSRTLDVAGNPNVASSMLHIKHYSSTPGIAVALYSFITAGLLGTALFSGALAISSANLAAAGAVLGQSTSCAGTDASRNLLGMAGHMQVLALTSFLAVSLPVEYAETANGLQWLIPHVNTPWQKSDETNYTSSFDSSGPTNFTFNFRRNLVSEPHDPVGEQAPSSACRMMHQRPTEYGYRNCSRHSESLASTDWPGTFMGDFLSGDRNPHKQSRRRLGANGTEFGPPMVAAAYETYFLNQAASLRKWKQELLAKKYTGWSDFQRNVFWLAVVCGSLILLHILVLFFLRWRFRTPFHSALSFPRFELFLLILALPALCQASAFIIRGGTKAGIAVGVVLLAIPAMLLLVTTLLLLFGIFRGKCVQYTELRPQLSPDETLSPPPSLSHLTGAGHLGSWTSTSASFIPRFGILFEDRKGPPKLADTYSNKTDGEPAEQAVSRAVTTLGCFQSAYILIDLSRRISLGVIFGAFPVTDKSWVELSLVLAVTTAQLLYLVATKPFQRRFVQVVETVSLLCEIGIFLAAVAILSQNQPYETHWGLGVFMLLLFVLSFFAQMTNEWFALIRQLLWFSNTEEIAPQASLKAFALGLGLPFLPRNRWPQFNTEAALQKERPQAAAPPMARASEVGHHSSSGGQAQSSPALSPVRVVGGVSKSAKPVISPPENWPGEDLQEWARQNSLERRRQQESAESELVSNPREHEILQADAASQFHYEAPMATVVSRSRHRPVHSDSLSDTLSSHGEDFRLDSPERTWATQHSIDVRHVS